MPRPGAVRGLPHAVQERVAAGDQLLENAGCAGEQVLDDERPLVDDEREARIARARGGHVGKAHGSTLPRRGSLGCVA